MASSSNRRTDYGEEFVEQLRKDRFKKSYILVNGVNSSEEEDEELDFDEEDDEIASYAMGGGQSQSFQQPPRPSSTHSTRRPPSVAASLSKRTGSGAFGFDAKDLYFFGVLTELTDKFTPDRAARFIAKSSPPYEYKTLSSIEKVAYLFYYSLYGRYLNVPKFHNVFNREFYKFTSAGDSERSAFLKICRLTLQEYKRRMLEKNKLAYKLAQKHLFSDERATSGSRASDRPSFADGDSENSLQSLANELMFYRGPHAPVHFAAKGRLVFVNPDVGISIVCIENTKKFYKDSESRRYVEAFENFKGPLLIDYTPPQTPLLFIQRQIERIYQSDVYRANPKSSDANDCILIWGLLEMLVRQQGKVTGPDLARLLCSGDSYSSFTNQNFLKTDSQTSLKSSASVADSQAMDRITKYLLGGNIEEAIESAIEDGLFFDALMLSNRLFRHDKLKQERIESKLMAYRSPNHPLTTLINVASDSPVSLLNNPTTDDTNSWRSHIAIVLANLSTQQNAMYSVFQLGQSLAKKEFNAAADFCFLAFSLLTGYNCFEEEEEESCLNNLEINARLNTRKHINLLNASIPDDSLNSCITRFGWSLLDYQATEIFDFALHLGNGNLPTFLSKSKNYIKTRKEYIQLLGELGGFDYSIELYSSSSSFPSPSLNESNKEEKTEKVFVLKHMELPKSVLIDKSYAHPTESYVNREMFTEVSNKELLRNQLCNIQSDEPPILIVNALHGEKYNSETSCEGESMQEITEVKKKKKQLTQPPTVPLQIQNFVCDNILPPIPLPTEESIELNEVTPQILPPQHSKITSNVSPPSRLRKQSSSSSSTTSNNIIPSKNEQQTTTTKTSTNKNPPSGFFTEKIGGFLSKITQLQGTNTMKLPDDKNPEIVWDPQKNKYVDQTGQSIEEEIVPPPPSINKNEQPILTSSTPVCDEEEQQQQYSPPPQLLQFPSIPNIIPVVASSSNTCVSAARPFQGRNRYANAWNS